jgi:hypothetical protein
VRKYQYAGRVLGEDKLVKVQGYKDLSVRRFSLVSYWILTCWFERSTSGDTIGCTPF